MPKSSAFSIPPKKKRKNIKWMQGFSPAKKTDDSERHYNAFMYWTLDRKLRNKSLKVTYRG